MSITLTTEQLAIIDAAALDPSAHLVIEARAGTGKTSTLMELIAKLRGTTCLQAYNKSIASELESKAQSLPFEARLNLTIGTVHALGLKAYSAGVGSRAKVQGGKVSFIQKDLWKANSRDEQYFKKVSSTLSRAVGSAKNSGFGITGSPEAFPQLESFDDWLDLFEHFSYDIEMEEATVDLERAINHCINVLKISNNQDHIIDFDDMIYLPLLRNYKLPTYNNVLIDEAQDISATRRELAFRMLDPNTSRIIAVGDEYQAIYGFTGADAESLRNIQRRSGAATYPLTTCWRCDEAIIEEAQQRVPDIKARPSAGPGLVDRVSFRDILDALGGSANERLGELKADDKIPRAGDAILCRLNRPNVSAALAYIRAGIPARIEGRDLGKKLLSHIKAADNLYAHHTIAELIVNLEDYGERQSNLLAAKGRESAAFLLDDEIEAMVLIMELAIENGGMDFTDVEAEVDSLFGDDIPPARVVTLSSVHKAKGREWPRVFILGRFDYMPFWIAQQDWEKQQEENLIYVACTRAERELYYITSVKEELDNRKDQ